jgi:hypothetical protein
MRWSSDSNKSKPNTWPICRNWMICKISMKIKRNSCWIQLENNKNKSKNLVPFLMFWWIRIKLTILSIIQSGFRKRRSGMFPILPIEKKIWDCPNWEIRGWYVSNHQSYKKIKNKLHLKTHSEIFKNQQMKEGSKSTTSSKMRDKAVIP